MKRSESIQNIAVALCKFQAEVKNPSNNAKNPMYKSKYATLDNVINTAKPVLAENGLSYIQSPSTTEDGLHMAITTLLMHESGEWIESEPLVLPAYKLGKDSVKVYDAQAAGIAITYGRRYSLSALLGISSEDDDDANGIIHEGNAKAKPSISSKQIGLIKMIVKELATHGNVGDDVIYGSLKRKIGDYGDLTKMNIEQASKAIDILNEWKKEKIGEKQGA